MQRILAIAVLSVSVTLLSAGRARAQMSVSFVAGPTLANISSDEYETSSKVGFFAAAGVSIPLSPAVALSPYLAYVQKGATFDSDDSDGSYNYIEIPLLLEFGMPLGESSRLGFSVGPAIGFQMSCDEDGFDCKEYEDHKGTEFSLLGAAGIGFGTSEASSFSVGVGFDLGLTDLYDGLSYKSRTIYLFLGYGVMLGG